MSLLALELESAQLRGQGRQQAGSVPRHGCYDNQISEFSACAYTYTVSNLTQAKVKSLCDLTWNTIDTYIWFFFQGLNNEIYILLNVKHERIVSFYGSQQIDGYLYLFMELMSGVRA